MIRKMQIKFVLTAMLVTILVTGSIFGFITFANYRTVNKRADTILNLISNNGGEFPEYTPHREYDGIITKETKYSTRYFYIKLNSSNEVVETNVKNIAAISQTEAEEIVKKILSFDRTSGYYGEYKYKITYKDNGEKLIVVLDYSFQLNNLYESTQKAIWIVIGGLTLVFIILTSVSKRVLTPIIKNIEKQKQFISNAGHELKTPIAVIMANSEVMEMTEKSEENLELIKSIKNQAQRLGELTALLLNLAKVEEGKIKNEFTDFDIVELIEEELKEFKYLAKDKEIVFNSTDSINIFADRANIKELIIIFLDNSIKYSNEHGKIIITAEKQGKNVKLQFMNTCDDPKEIDVSKIFDRFYRDDKSRNKEKEGYGIGLSMAKSIVDIHKGKLSAEITKENMVCFTVIL